MFLYTLHGLAIFAAMNIRLTFALCLLSASVFAQDAHYLSFANADEMRAFFTYREGRHIISGHRGTVERGLPENSIAGMQEVLKVTPAIFEVDPRLTKDSVPVMLHDATLDRTTTGSGLLKEHRWDMIKSLKLKDKAGAATPYTINTLDEMIVWAKGRTILNLDKKSLPLEMTAEIIRRHDAYAWVWVTVHDVAQAKFFLQKDPAQFVSMHIKSKPALDAFLASGLPFHRMIVYIGPELNEENRAIYTFLKEKGVMCMVSTAPSADKLVDEEKRAAAYKAIFDEGISILESDYPMEVSRVLTK